MLHRFLLAPSILVGLALGAVRAQESATAELLQLVPNDFALCFIVNDLRGQLERWNKTTWMKKLDDNPLVKDMLDPREVAKLKEIEKTLKQHLQVDLPILRDDILGDAIVLAYQPPPKGQAAGEKGLLLLKVRSADTLAGVLKRVNEVQAKAGELTSLDELKHNDKIYYRRVHQKATHFYVQKGVFFALSSQEDAIKALLDREASAPSPRRDHWLKAGLSKAVATLWFDPRAFDAELAAQAAAKGGPEAALYQSVITFWKDLDGVMLSLQGDDDLEFRLSLLARPATQAAKLWSEPPTVPSDLWRRFPDNALITVAGPIDFAATFKKLRESLPEKDGGAIDALLQKNVGALIGLDIPREILPNVGPDVGFTVTLPEGDAMPRAMFALAVKSAPKDSPVDQMLYRASQVFLHFALVDYNRKNDPIRVQTIKQDDVEVTCLTKGKLFPPGVQPAIALKGGYFLVASSPEAIASFRAERQTGQPSDETPLLKIAPREWSRLMKAYRQPLIDHLVQKNKETPAAAGNVVDGVVAGLELFQSLTVTQRVGNGQAAWIVRLSAVKN